MQASSGAPVVMVFSGSLAVGDNTGTQLGGNTIDGHGTGVWVVDGYGLAIGSETGTDPAETVPGDSSLIGNVMANNTGNGIVIQINDADLGKTLAASRAKISPDGTNVSKWN